MTKLVNASPVTWAAISNVIWYGSVPSYRVAKAISDVTGFSVDDIMKGCELTSAQRRRSLERNEAA